MNSSQPKIFGIRSLFILFLLVLHWIVYTEMITTITFITPNRKWVFEIFCHLFQDLRENKGTLWV